VTELSDLELLDALGVEAKPNKKKARTPREERIIAGFEEVQKFVEQNKRLPAHGENNDIFERLYATRLDQICKQEECRALLQNLDHQGLLDITNGVAIEMADDIEDEELLSQLGVSRLDDSDVTQLRHVKPRAEIRAAEEIANRNLCENFEVFKPIFEAVKKELDSGVRITRPFKDNAEVKKDDLFILTGQIVYVAEVGEEFIPEHGRPDCRLRVIYDNGTESDLLMRSLQRALNKDKAGRRITNPSAGPLFADNIEDDDLPSGTIYVLRSLSNHSLVSENREIIHKIGVTVGSVEKRIANAKLDPTFLMAGVEIVATYNLSNINRTKLEKLIHRIFDAARLNIKIKDRFGNPIIPREWFLVPLFVIDEAVTKIKDGTIGDYIFDIENARLDLRRKVQQGES